LVEVDSLQTVKFEGGVEKGRAAANDDTLLGGSAGGAKSILDAVLELADLNFGSATDLNDGNTSGESAHALL